MIETENFFSGKLVRLVAIDPERDSKFLSKWRQNSEYARLLDDFPATLFSSRANQEWMEKHLDDFLEFEYNIQDIKTQELIGLVDLGGNMRFHQDAFVGIGIGDPEYWGKGYGTEAMAIILRYAFMELNLHRVSLNVFGYNARAIRSYQKNGFVTEGISKNAIERDGQFWDIVWMGILRDEWLRIKKEIE